MKIFAAVIEWPDDFVKSPALIVEKSNYDRTEAVRAEIVDVANALVDPEWREILADHRYFPQYLQSWLSMFDEARRAPVVTTYEREV